MNTNQTPNPNAQYFINDTTNMLGLTNDDGNTLADLLPPFPIPNLIGYTDAAELLGLLDAHSEQYIAEADNLLGVIEDCAIKLHRLDRSRHSVWLDALTTIAENSRDLLDD